MSTPTPRLNRSLTAVLCFFAIAACSDAGTAPEAEMTLLMDPTHLTLAHGQERKINLISDGSALPATVTQTWASSNESVVTVDGSGRVQAVGAGQATVTASARYQLRTGQATATVVVSQGAESVESIQLSPDTLALLVNGTGRLTATAQSGQGATASGVVFTWTSSDPAVAEVDEAGNVLAKATGVAQIEAASGVQSANATVIVVATPAVPASVTVTPSSASLPKGDSLAANAVARDAAGNIVAGGMVSWTSSNPSVAQVTTAGLVRAMAAGAAVITATTGAVTGTLSLTVPGSAQPKPPVGSNGELVTFPNDEIAFVIGPQLKSGSAENPWPFYDENAIETGHRHGPEFHENPAQRSYYDQARVQYINYYRTGDERFLTYARDIADAWYARSEPLGTGIAPRSAAVSGLILRALDGRPEMWEWIVRWTDHHLRTWLELRFDKENLHYGLRDGGYALYYGALVAASHPNQQVRNEYRQRVLRVARDYYAHRQYENGGWYWGDSAAGVRIQKEDGSYYLHSQPFMVGLMLEGLVAVHRLTGDPVVRDAILKGTTWLYQYGHRANEPSPVDGVNWRGGWYFVFEPGTPLPDPSDYAEGTHPRYGADGVTVVQGTTRLRGGWDTNSIRDARQLSPTTVHAYGYAYKISGDVRFRQWGDEVFSASFGKGRGPGADPYYSLADYIARNYNQAYRSSGTYLVYRTGR